MSFKKTDILILGKMESSGAINPLKSATIQKIREKSGYSATKVRASIKMLLEEGLIAEGFMCKNAKAYFVTEKGKELLQSFGCKVREDKNNI